MRETTIDHSRFVLEVGETALTDRRKFDRRVSHFIHPFVCAATFHGLSFNVHVRERDIVTKKYQRQRRRMNTNPRFKSRASARDEGDEDDGGNDDRVQGPK